MPRCTYNSNIFLSLIKHSLSSDGFSSKVWEHWVWTVEPIGTNFKVALLAPRSMFNRLQIPQLLYVLCYEIFLRHDWLLCTTGHVLIILDLDVNLAHLRVMLHWIFLHRGRRLLRLNVLYLIQRWFKLSWLLKKFWVKVLSRFNGRFALNGDVLRL